MIRRLLLIGAGFALFFATAYWASVSALSPVRQETLAQPRVFAYRGWQSIGVQLNEGDFVTIRASARVAVYAGRISRGRKAMRASPAGVSTRFPGGL